MEQVTKRKNRTLIYETQGDRVKVKRSIPSDGFFVFEVQTTYAKNLHNSKYFIYGKTANEVKKQFAEHLPWLNMVRSIRKITDKDELEEILTNPMKMPI